jgi:hypothetical protein
VSWRQVFKLLSPFEVFCCQKLDSQSYFSAFFLTANALAYLGGEFFFQTLPTADLFNLKFGEYY